MTKFILAHKQHMSHIGFRGWIYNFEQHGGVGSIFIG